MKRAFHIAGFVLVYAFAACNNNPQQTGKLEESLTDTTAAPVEEAQDTTLQPRVEVLLRATGNTPEEMTFEQDTLEVPENALVKLTLVNEGIGLTIIHNFVLTAEGKYKEVAIKGAAAGSTKNYVPEGGKNVIASTPLALPGQTVVQEFKAPAPGTYDFVCTYPDHWKKMHGKFIVKKKAD